MSEKRILIAHTYNYDRLGVRDPILSKNFPVATIRASYRLRW